MGYSIDAIIGHKTVDKNAAQKLGLPLIFESDFVIVPLIEENIYHYGIENDIEYTDYGEDITWDCNIVTIFTELLDFKSYVIMDLCTDFIGSFYEKGKKSIHEVDINMALNLLGVPKLRGSEFEYLNLNNYRRSEFYYMNEIVGHKDTSNMVKGKILYPNYGQK